MPHLFTKITPDEIKQLGSDTLIRLLHRLLLCEARAMALAQHGILVPYEITVPDGGSDGEWKAKGNTNEFIPREWTRYQSKADRVTSGMCRSEIAPPDKNGNLHIKARVREVLEAGGCYAFFSNGHEVKPSGDEDIDTVARDQMAKAGFKPAAGAVIEFYGCNRIADWTNKFPAAVRYVREITKGFGGLHYFTFDGWAKHANVSGPFFENEAVVKKIATIRETLLEGKTRMIRLTGLSGVGKSRLVYEALKPSSSGNVQQDSLAASCIYLSYETVAADLLGLIAHLADDGYAAIVVVDDCPPEIHDQIANIVGKSLLTVISIFHEPQQQRKDSFPLNLAPEEMGEVVEQILRADANLAARGGEAIRAVASFSQGFPQIAKLIVEFHRAPTAEELNDRAKLFQKLLSRGDDPDDVTLLTAQSLALFRTIGGSRGKLEADLSTIRELFCPDISEVDYRRSIQRQRTRRIIQQIADTLVLTPRPLGVALAADFITFFPTGKWKEVVERLSKARLLDEFLKRVEELEFSENAEELGKMLLESGFPFDDAEYLLTGMGSQIFRSLTVLSPSAAIKIAKQALHNCSLDMLRNSKESRRGLVRALELLVWEPKTFQDGAELLLKLAAAENEGWANNATGAFNQLFNLNLSGTKVPAQERLGVIKNALQSDESATRNIAIGALGKALNFRFFSRMGDTTLGGKRDANLDWHPRSNREAMDYWRECFHILSSIILANGRDAERAKDVLGKNIDVILQTPLLLELEPEINELAAHIGRLWPDVKDRIRKILDLRDNITGAHKEALHRCKAYLTPPESRLEAKLQDLVTKPGWHHRKGADGSYTDTSREEAEHFASELAENGTNLVPLLPYLLLGEQQQTFSFGTVLGKKHPQAEELVNAIIELWPSLDPKQRNPSFAKGLMRGIGREKAFRTEILDRVATSAATIDLLVPLTASLDVMDQSEFLRIRNAVVESQLDPSQLRSLIQGLPIRTLPESFLTEQFTVILDAKPASAQMLFELLFQLCYRGTKRFEQFADLFRSLLLTKGLELGDSHFGWEWHETALKLISLGNEPEWLKSVSQYICDTVVQNKTWIGTDYLSIVASTLFEKSPTETWSPFAAALDGGDEFAKYVLAEFLGDSGSMFENSASPLWSLPKDQFQTWVKNHRKLIPLILEKMSLYTVEKLPDDKERFRWHPHALLLMAEGSSEEELEQAVFGNLFSFGSTGSRVPYLEKRIELVRDLAIAGNDKLTRISHTVEEWLATEIERTKREELNTHARYH